MSKALPLVSVIIPCYNCELYVEDCLISVLNQSYQKMEIFAVNDGSTDRTLQILQQYKDRVKIISQKNAGVSAARNTGIMHSRGDFIAFIDADDLWDKHKIQVQVDYFLEHDEIGAVFCQWEVVGRNYKLKKTEEFGKKNMVESDPECSGWIYHKLLMDCIIHTSSLVIRKNIVDTIGKFNTVLATGEDYDYWIRLSRIAQVHKLKNVLSFYRNTGTGLTSTPARDCAEYMIIKNAAIQWGLNSTDARGVEKKKFKERLSKVAEGFAYEHYIKGDINISAKWYYLSLLQNPFAFRALYGWARSFVLSLLATYDHHS